MSRGTPAEEESPPEREADADAAEPSPDAGAAALWCCMPWCIPWSCPAVAVVAAVAGASVAAGTSITVIAAQPMASRRYAARPARRTARSPDQARPTANTSSPSTAEVRPCPASSITAITAAITRCQASRSRRWPSGRIAGTNARATQ